METDRPSSLREDRVTLASYLAGSHLYGLNTPESDKDVRLIYRSTSLKHILGTKPDEFTDHRNDDKDVFYSEIRHFMLLLARSSTNSVECLFATNFEFIDPAFSSLVLDNKQRLVDGRKLVSSTLGYITNERRLANGERTGDLGSKRKIALEKYGFSPKNYTNLIRLCWCTKEFIRTGNYPINVTGTELYDLMKSIKTNPEKHKASELDAISREEEAKLVALKNDLDAPGYAYKFDADYATDVLLRLYKPTIDECYEKKRDTN